MVTELDLGGIEVEVVQKDIKNIHLSVNPPTGKVRISAPLSMNLDSIRAFALTKLLWIKEQQKKIQGQLREVPREFLERESHYVWGKRYLLNISETEGTPKVELQHDKLIIHAKAGAPTTKLREILDDWYREQIRCEVPAIADRWEQVLKVSIDKLHVQQMKTKWGGCNPETGSIRINSELAKKPIEYLEYVVLHEMVHLIEPSHSERFKAIMDQCLSNWRHIRDELNRLPVPYGEWN